MKTAIIFGCTGMDGSHLSELLLDKDYHVTGVTRRTSLPNTARLKNVLDNEQFQLVSADLTDMSSITSLFKNFEDLDGKIEIYNLAAQSHVQVSFKQPSLTWDVTGKGTLNILQSILQSKIKDFRFYQASSSEMFGSSFSYKSHPHVPAAHYDLMTEIGKYTMKEEKGVKYQDEDTPFLPQSPYAIAKCASHYLVRLYREAYGIHASSGILFNHEGPRRGENFVTRKITCWLGEFVKWRKRAGDLIHAVEDQIKFKDGDDNIHMNQFSFPKLRLGNLNACRDWGYAGDYVNAMWLMLQEEDPDDYVICTGETHSIKDFLTVAFKEIGVDDWTNYVVVDQEFYRPAEVDYLRGCNDKAKHKLKWEPEHSFEDLVRLMVKHDVNENLQNTHESIFSNF